MLNSILFEVIDPPGAVLKLVIESNPFLSGEHLVDALSGLVAFPRGSVALIHGCASTMDQAMTLTAGLV